MGVLLVRGWAAHGSLERARLQPENERLRSDVTLLTREFELKDAHMATRASRPHSHGESSPQRSAPREVAPQSC